MPKIHDTRMQKATQLFARIEHGPSIDLVGVDGIPITSLEYRRRYHAWFESWIREDLIRLVPELRTRIAF